MKTFKECHGGRRVVLAYLVGRGADDVVPAVDDRLPAVWVLPPHLGRLGPGVHGTLQRDRGALRNTHQLPRPDLGSTCIKGKNGRQEGIRLVRHHPNTTGILTFPPTTPSYNLFPPFIFPAIVIIS